MEVQSLLSSEGNELSSPGLEEKLERGELLYFPTAPFSLPDGDDRTFLLQQRLGLDRVRNIYCNPIRGKARGHQDQGPAADERLSHLLMDFSRAVTQWLTETLPRYRSHCQPDRVTLRTEEEATRRLRLNARNDLLHIDAFPNRPTFGRRILRVYANINPTEPRVWLTSDPFARLLGRFAHEVGLPSEMDVGWMNRLRTGMVRLFRPHRARRPAYDAFMLRFHDFLKQHEEFQERGPRRLWTFPPGSVWMAMTDACSHAVLRGRFALEHSFFIPPQALTLPEEAPAALLTFACAAHHFHAA